MRDLSTEELGFVYGAGRSPKPPKKRRCKKRGSGSRGSKSRGSRGRSGSGSRKRCKGGSSS